MAGREEETFYALDMYACLSADCHLRSRPPSSDQASTRPDCRRAACNRKIGVPGVRKASCLRLGAGADNDSSPYPAVVRTPRRLSLPNLAAACAAGYSLLLSFHYSRSQAAVLLVPPAGILLQNLRTARSTVLFRAMHLSFAWPPTTTHRALISFLSIAPSCAPRASRRHLTPDSVHGKI